MVSCWLLTFITSSNQWFPIRAASVGHSTLIIATWQLGVIGQLFIASNFSCPRGTRELLLGYRVHLVSQTVVWGMVNNTFLSYNSLVCMSICQSICMANFPFLFPVQQSKGWRDIVITMFVCQLFCSQIISPNPLGKSFSYCTYMISRVCSCALWGWWTVSYSLPRLSSPSFFWWILFPELLSKMMRWIWTVLKQWRSSDTLDIIIFG